MKGQDSSQFNSEDHELPLKGHVYCKALFDEVFLPVLKERFPDVLPRLSAGIIGVGSDVLGADDELSRDHDWGPNKCQLLLSEQDIAAYGSSISQALEAAIPDELLGIETAKLRPKTIRISTIDAVYHDFHESAYPPVTIEEWAAADDNHICYARRLVLFSTTLLMPLANVYPLSKRHTTRQTSGSGRLRVISGEFGTMATTIRAIV